MNENEHNLLVTVLVYHQATNTSGCICGWNILGASHAEHVVDVYEKCLKQANAQVIEEADDLIDAFKKMSESCYKFSDAVARMAEQYIKVCDFLDALKKSEQKGIT